MINDGDIEHLLLDPCVYAIYPMLCLWDLRTTKKYSNDIFTAISNRATIAILLYLVRLISLLKK